MENLKQVQVDSLYELYLSLGKAKQEAFNLKKSDLFKMLKKEQDGVYEEMVQLSDELEEAA